MKHLKRFLLVRKIVQYRPINVEFWQRTRQKKKYDWLKEEIVAFADTTRAYNSSVFSPVRYCLFFKTIYANLDKGYFIHIVITGLFGFRTFWIFMITYSKLC